jgi:hypothetical protein
MAEGIPPRELRACWIVYQEGFQDDPKKRVRKSFQYFFSPVAKGENPRLWETYIDRARARIEEADREGEPPALPFEGEGAA